MQLVKGMKIMTRRKEKKRKKKRRRGRLWLRKGQPYHPFSGKLKTIYKSRSVEFIKGGIIYSE